MIRLAVRCTPELAERVLAELVELVPGGVEEDRGETYVEYAIYGPPGELPAMPDIEAAAGDGLVEISSTEIPDDWTDAWKDFHQPVRIGPLCVRPPWAHPDPDAALDIAIDPGQAFGTGGHATTRMCLELLVELADRGAAGGALADLGTGSAVLAIAAAKLGWSPVTGFDHELPAVEAARVNAELNGAAVDVVRMNLRDELPRLAATVVANLTRPLLVEIARRLPATGDPSRLLLSGLLSSEREEITGAYATLGFTVEQSAESGDWAALLLERVGPPR